MKSSWYRLSVSSHAYLHHCYNILVRAVATTIVVAALFGLSVILNWVVHKALEQVGASIEVQNTLSVIVVSSMVAMAVGLAVINLLDVWSLVKANARSAVQGDQEVKDG